MKQGPSSFLTTRPAAEAFETVRRLYADEGFIVRKVAKRIGVHYGTLYRWLRANPEYLRELETMRAQHFQEQVKNG
jgi:transposase